MEDESLDSNSLLCMGDSQMCRKVKGTAKAVYSRNNSSFVCFASDNVLAPVYPLKRTEGELEL